MINGSITVRKRGFSGMIWPISSYLIGLQINLAQHRMKSFAFYSFKTEKSAMDINKKGCHLRAAFL